VENGKPDKGKKDRKLSAVERLIAKSIGDGRTLGRDDDPARDKYPDLWDFLTRWIVSSKEMKSPATLSIKAGPEGFVATISDRDMQLGLDVAIPHLGELLDRIEAAIGDPNTAWKNWGRKEPKFRKRNT